jgi:two-component system OmpR family response regulator
MGEAVRILVVDDQPDILDLTATVLRGAGYTVEAVASGQEALVRLSRDPFHLVLLDINMPDMDGWETLRIIRADDALGTLPVVMFSVKGELHDKVHGMQEGAQDFITKPFVIDRLLERVERILAAAGVEDAPDASATPHPPGEESC